MASASLRPLKARSVLRSAAGEASHLLVEGVWSTSVHSHTAFEPHVAVAEWREDGHLALYLSTQGVTRNHASLARALDLDPDHLELVAEYVGGAFGAKQSHGIEPVAAALLARNAGTAVRIELDRVEELSVGGNRPGVDVELRLAADREGTLTALRVEAYADGGASAGSLVASGLPRFLYPGAPRLLLDYDVVSTAPPGIAFRAPGGPPALFALEQAVDELARRLDTDPVELRRRWNDRPLRAAMYDWVASSPLWRSRFEPRGRRLSRGVGVAFGSWFQGHDPATTVTVTSSEGGFRVATGAQDLGNGTASALAAAVADAFGIEPSLITVELGRSSLGTGPMSSGSRTTASVVPAASDAAVRVRDRLLADARAVLGLEGARAVDGGLSHAGEHLSWEELLPRLSPVEMTSRRPADTRRFLPFDINGLRVGSGMTESAHIVEVEVDELVGSIRVRRVETCIAAGRMHAPVVARSHRRLGGGRGGRPAPDDRAQGPPSPGMRARRRGPRPGRRRRRR